MAKKLLAFPYMGGKFRDLKWLLPLLPKTPRYIEPFGGAASVLINREPCKNETYNDLNGDIVNFFRVLRDHGDELRRRIDLTPFSREEFAECIKGPLGEDPIEDARRFYVAACQSFAGKGGLSRTSGNWAMRNGKNPSIHEPQKYRNRIDLLNQITWRFRKVQIENRPALGLLKYFDSPETLFYLDPPYTNDTHSGDVFKQFGDAEQLNLLEAIKPLRGMVALSGYDNPLYDEHLPNWFKTTKSKPRAAGIQTGKCKTVVEALWTNYNPENVKHDIAA